jgi:hypothetical protein
VPSSFCSFCFSGSILLTALLFVHKNFCT